jgi:L-alanine-DL-glutamate epimerase-like enolase superfamily enzyme
MQDLIDRVEVWACCVPLPAPLSFGSFSISSRRYVALRIHTAGGLSSDVVSHSRGSPVDVAIADVLGPRLLGRDPTDIDARRDDFLNATVAMERDGVLGRAWSLLELALQGLGAAARKLPAWQHLGGESRELPVQLVEGYALPDESDGAFVERLLQRVQMGYLALKIEGAHYGDSGDLERRLAMIRREAPECRLVVDFAWSWQSASDHREMLAALGHLGVDWIEDAFSLQSIQEYVIAGSMTSAPIGAGDEATRVADLIALVHAGALQVVRLDATALGGFSAVVPLATTLRQLNRRISFHDFPEIHQHSALVDRACDHIEMFPADRPFDVRHYLTTHSAHDRVHAGKLTPSTEPGLGIALDLEQVGRYTTRYGQLNA